MAARSGFSAGRSDGVVVWGVEGVVELDIYAPCADYFARDGEQVS